MDVIDELIACCEAWEPWARVMGNVCAGDAAQALRSLRAELAECREDAERYRHVRTNPAMLLHLSNKAFDDAIDAARKGEGDI